MTQNSKALVLVMYTLIAIGVIMIYSASAVYASTYYQSPAHFLWRHLISVLIGSIAFLFFMSVDPNLLRKYSRFLITISIFMLILVFVPFIGRSAGGARRWVQLAFLNFQPVEYAKLALCVYLSDYLARKQVVISSGSIFIFLAPFAICAAMGLLTLAQPDLGSCAFMMSMAALLFFLAGIRPVFVIAAAIMAVSALVFLIMAAPYRMSRIAAYLNPWSDPQGSGFQIIQSFLAFGLGGIQGAGLGQSTQKLFYLPQSHTDFIFSIIGEELGLLGSCTVVALYGFFFFFGMKIVENLRETFSKLLATSLVFLITLQALLNLLVAVGLIPTKGLPLPFISYGGSALVLHMASVGLLISLDRGASQHYSG